MQKVVRWIIVILFTAVCVNSVQAQSRLNGDKYTISVANFPDSFGTTYDPVFIPRGEDFFDFESLDNDGEDWGGSPVELTFDGVEEQAGSLLVNERVVQWPGRDGGILGIQAAGIDGETEFDILDWEAEGEVIEFSFKTANGGPLADEPDDHSFYSLLGLDWANSDSNEKPYFFENGFYFYYAKDGVPVKGYEVQLEEIGLLVGEHPFDETVEEVVYIAYSRDQVEETTKPYEGGYHLTGGTTQLDENDASWNLLLQTVGIAPSGQNELHWGMLTEPPQGEDIVFENGDTDLNGMIDVDDLDLLSQAVLAGTVEPRFDLNNDNLVNETDREVWVEEIKNTWFGDSNLDGQFNSGDFVTVFTAGEYEDTIDNNSTWGTGDWNGDSEFNSGDFVLAFSKGGYEMGARTAVAAVPEPQSLAIVGLVLTFFSLRSRRSCRRV